MELPMDTAALWARVLANSEAFINGKCMITEGGVSLEKGIVDVLLLWRHLTGC